MPFGIRKYEDINIMYQDNITPSPTPLNSSIRVCHQIDHIHCCPMFLCHLAVYKEIDNTVSIFHHNLTGLGGQMTV